MAGLSEPVSPGASGDTSDLDVTAQRPIAVHTCSRLGRVANPPGISFSAWCRVGRRG